MFLSKLSFMIALAALWAGALCSQTAAGQSNSSQSSDPTQEYQGPSILSRDKSLLGERGGKLIDFRFYGQLTGIYDSGLTPVAVDANANLVNTGASYGIDAGFGVFGSRRWRRDQLNIEYRGNYRHYPTSPYFDGIDQFLNLGYARVLTRRLNLELKETAGTTSLANGGFSYVPLTNTDLFAVPANELFDNRTNFIQSRVDLTWQQTARLSYRVGGQGFVVRRRSFALAGLDGFGSHGDVSYRITRRQTVSLEYEFSHFDFQRTFGDADIHTASMGWNISLGRKWDLSVQAGAARTFVRGLTQVSIDPAIAAIVGRNIAVVQFDRAVTIPSYGGRATRRFDRSSLSLNANVGATPGNGVYLTSRQTALAAGYSYTGLRKWTLGATAAYSELSALGQSLGKFKNFQGGVGATYKVANATHLEFRYDLRHYTTQNNAFKKNSDRFSLGIAFSPGETPLAIW